MKNDNKLKKIETALFFSNVKAGFPSPATDEIEKKLDLNEFMIKHPVATFFVRVSGDSMKDAAISSGDILVIDRSLDPKHSQIVLAVVDGEFTVKTLKLKGDKIFLVPENSKYKIIEITKSMDFKIWGVVTGVIRKY